MIEKGIVLAGGLGTRLRPLTSTTSKQLVPVYDQHMVMYPIRQMMKAEISKIALIVAQGMTGEFERVIAAYNLPVKFTYIEQPSPDGIAQAYILAEDSGFLKNEPSALILGDNLFGDDLSESIKNFQVGSYIFTISVPDPERFGVLEINDDGDPVRIVEKPKVARSKLAITGAYLADDRACDIARKLKPSDRGELEITDLLSFYLRTGELYYTVLKEPWFDCGTFDSLHDAAGYVKLLRRAGR